MQARLIAYAVGLILRSIDPQDVAELIDDLLDRIEDRYKDKQTIMQLVNLARQVLSIPDDIGGDED